MSKITEFKLPREDMTRGKEMAMGLTKALNELDLNVKVVYRSEGIYDGYVYGVFKFELED